MSYAVLLVPHVSSLRGLGIRECHVCLRVSVRAGLIPNSNWCHLRLLCIEADVILDAKEGKSMHWTLSGDWAEVEIQSVKKNKRMLCINAARFVKYHKIVKVL